MAAVITHRQRGVTMHHPYRLASARAAACLLLAAGAVQVQAQESAAAAADPQAAVPATRYQPVLNYRPEAAPESSPDRNWVAGNAKVAATNSMALTMKPMSGHAGHGQHDHAAMQNMSMPAQKDEAPAMCAPNAGKGGDGKGKMACCESGCKCCKERS
jgi:hypothetical protein